jgi:hypothetical protein
MTSSKNDTLVSEVDIVEENLVEFQTRLENLHGVLDTMQRTLAYRQKKLLLRATSSLEKALREEDAAANGATEEIFFQAQQSATMAQQQYLLAKQELVNIMKAAIQKPTLNESRRITMPSIPGYNIGFHLEDPSKNMTNVVEWFEKVEATFKAAEYPIANWFRALTSAMNATDRSHVVTVMESKIPEIISAEEWIEHVRKPFILWAGGDLQEITTAKEMLYTGSTQFAKQGMDGYIKWYNQMLVRLEIQGGARDHLLVVVGFMHGLPTSINSMVRNSYYWRARIIEALPFVNLTRLWNWP